MNFLGIDSSLPCYKIQNRTDDCAAKRHHYCCVRRVMNVSLLRVRILQKVCVAGHKGNLLRTHGFKVMHNSPLDCSGPLWWSFCEFNRRLRSPTKIPLWCNGMHSPNFRVTHFLPNNNGLLIMERLFRWLHSNPVQLRRSRSGFYGKEESYIRSIASLRDRRTTLSLSLSVLKSLEGYPKGL